ncbi:MAG: repeat-containing protein [Candidatus Aminicenantes bacterium]|nr:repeat-containing protein [Candidatus Aminicenantes bacterium]
MIPARVSRTIATFFLLAALAGPPLSFGQQAVVKEEHVTFKTYPFSDPDPRPLIGPIYPYFRFNGYSLKGRPQDWKMVRLENPFVKVLVAPEIGGKVWGAVEKSTGREFIYWNPVVKFREIAMRGPWASGGIELNFGVIGHAPTTATPVDYAVLENADGSVSCVVGAIDLPSRTVWRVNVRLPKDAAYLETECFWYNPTSLHDSLYNWLTSAQDVGEDLKYYYPGTHYIGHGGDAHPWPILENGRDASYYRNNDFGGSKSYHILGELGETFGGYYEKSGFGYGHWAAYDEKPGMKLWIWSLARDGGIWEDLLTDPPKKQYTEPQTGLLYNQAGNDSGLTPFKHIFFAPQSVMHWKEIWFPVKDIGGLTAASPYAALNVESGKGAIKIGLCPLRPIDDDLIVTMDGETVFSRRLTLKPMETFVQTIHTGGKQGEVDVTLGREKLRWTSRDKDINKLSRPVEAPRDFNWSSAEGLYVAGEELARQRSYDEALDKFRACLAKEPGHVRALTRLAEILFRRTEDLEALDTARKALAIDAYDPGANFIYGTISRRLGRYADAKDGFSWAARSLEYRSASYEQLAELNVLEDKRDRAAEYARRSLEYNPLNMNARELQAILLRLGEDGKGAHAALDEILRIDPLSHFSRFERFLLDPGAANGEAFASSVGGELPHETYLELACFYFNLGLAEEAASVMRFAPSHPLVHYWLAYLGRDEDEVESRRHLREAEAASPQLVFPHRREDLPVLRWAEEKTVGWKTSYYLGLLLWNFGMMDETKAVFEKLADRPDWAPFYLTRARLLENEGGRETILADIQRAIGLDKQDWRAWRAQTGFYEKQGECEQAFRSAKGIYEMQPGKPALAMDYAKSLLRIGRYAECIKVLERTHVLPYEGAWEGRDLCRQAYLLSAALSFKNKKYKAVAASVEKARLWPENLGVGKPFDVDERLENFILAAAVEKSGDRPKADKLYSSVCADTEKFRASWDSVHLLGALALKKTGKAEEAARLFRDWRGVRGDEDPVFSWAFAKFNGDEQGAQGTLLKLRGTAAGVTRDLGTGDRNLFLIMEVLSAISHR